MRAALSRIADLVVRRRRDRRLADEIAAHLEELAAMYEARGMTRDDARLAARRAFGGVDQIAFDHREQRGLPWVDSLVQDVLFAIRLMVKDRWFSAAGVFALALGIGLSTTIFALVNGIALRELPVDDPPSVVHLVTFTPRGRADSSYPDFADWRRSARSFAGLAAYVDRVVTVGDGRRAADQLADAHVSWDAFALLGEQPVIGRTFEPADDRAGAAPVTVLSHRVWAARYGASPDVLGQTIRIDGMPATIVGVMREGFRFPIWADLWQPLSALPGLTRDDRQQRTLGAFGRLARGTTVASANREMARISEALAAEYPASNQDTRVEVMPFTERFAGRITEPAPLLMLCAVALILLIACANAAMLLLARAAPRAREVALRTAMGASRGRILRQLLIESLVLSAVSGGFGVAIGFAGVRLLGRELADLNLPYWMQFEFDRRVVTFIVAISVATALGAGLAPAWHLSRTRAHELLKDGGRGITGGPRARRWSAALLVAELALTLTLLAAAGLLSRSAAELRDADRVVDPANLLTARIALPATRFGTAADRRRFYQRLDETLAADPVTRDAALTTALPFSGSPSRQVRLDGLDDSSAPPVAQVVAVSDRYFATLGLPIVRGRAFGLLDGEADRHTAIVNQRFVEMYSPDRDPLGRQLQLIERARPANQNGPSLTIVGVAPTFRQSPMRDALPVVFLPLRAQPAPSVSLIVPQRNRPALAAALIEHARQIDPDVALFKFSPLDRVSELSRFNHRMMSGTLSLMAGIALFLCAIGLYGVTAFGVAQRTAEIGIRLALGGTRSQLTWQLLRRTVALIASGLALGLAGAIGAGQLLGGLLINTSPLDTPTFAIVIGMLCALAVTACLVPASRAMRLDPVAALRHE
jgi:putative ABC transport system permease protein